MVLIIPSCITLLAAIPPLEGFVGGRGNRFLGKSMQYAKKLVLVRLCVITGA